MYNWGGMTKISKEDAIKRWKENKCTYLLYDDNTESMVDSLKDIEDHEVEFGYE